jgi:hypothetical protein
MGVKGQRSQTGEKEGKHLSGKRFVEKVMMFLREGLFCPKYLF